MSLDIFDILLYYYIHVCVLRHVHFMNSPLWLAVGPQSLSVGFDYMAFAVSRKVGYPYTGLTTQVG